MLTVLHIDDDPEVRFLLRELVAEQPNAADFRWLEASQVEEALALHGDAQPDLILLDNRLGYEEGVAVLPRLRSAFPCPVWMLSSAFSDRLTEQAQAAGAAGVATKDEVLGAPSRLASFLLRAAAVSAHGVSES
jgi:DNA-binding NarL/FixJ family response regulator